VIETSAREVIGAEVADARITCRKGCNSEGVSNWCISGRMLEESFLRALNPKIPLQPTSSRLSRPNPAINGLSCMLFPFFPRRPHLLASPSSSPPSVYPKEDLLLRPFRLPESSRGVEGRESCVPGFKGDVTPRIADTDECAHRACLRMADVTVMHSVVIKATGSTATETVAFEAMLGPFDRGIWNSDVLDSSMDEDMRPYIEDSRGSTVCRDVWGSGTRSSSLILYAA
jgi:hypothetical protein